MKPKLLVIASTLRHPFHHASRPIRIGGQVIAASLLAASSGWAAPVSWQTPAPVTADTDINLNGTLTHAGTFRDSGTATVTLGSENIVFANRPAQNGLGGLQSGEEARVVQGSGGKQNSADLFNATGTTVSTSFETALDGSAWENGDPGPAPGATDMILRVTGVGGGALIPGQTYQIQLFCSDDRAGSATRAQRYHDGVGNFSEFFLHSASTGVIGFFTADSTGYQDFHAQNTSGESSFPVAINANVLRAVSGTDTDGDSLPDAWETAYGLDPNDNSSVNGASGDPDGDLYTNFDEYQAGSNPQDIISTPADVDGDGLLDTWEIDNFESLGQFGDDDPDGDYATNEEEEIAETDPSVRTSAPDSDVDGIGDAWELYFFPDDLDLDTATNISDSDLDTVSDLDEFWNNTNPTDATDPLSGTNVITWATPATITDDTQIISTGALLHAGNFRSDDANTKIDVTVGSETISFENRQSQNEPNLLTGEEARVIAGSGGRQENAALFDATGTNVSQLFESVLDGSAYENADAGPAPGATDMILRVTGVDGAALIPRQTYQIQLFYSDDRASSSTRGQIFHDDAIDGNQSEVMVAGDSKAVVGTFTADSSGYQDIHIQNYTGDANFPVAINAYVLRTVAADNDTDDDGMDDTWETNYFVDLSQTATGDFDGDGTDNLTEYRLGLTPNNGSSRFAVTTTDNALGDGYTITWQGKAGLNFTVERSTTLEAASWTNLTLIPQTGEEGTNTFTDPAVPAGKAFYRILLQP